jgi:uncharacterized protein
VRVAFVGRDADAGRVPEEYDAVTAPGGRIRLDEFIEEELLLALPLVPMHPTLEECAVRHPAPATTPRTSANGNRTRPFAELRTMMKR